MTLVGDYKVVILRSIGRSRSRCGTEEPKLDVLVPAVAAVVLQADVSRARMILVGDIEFVSRAIGSLVRFLPLDIQGHPQFPLVAPSSLPIDSTSR